MLVLVLLLLGITMAMVWVSRQTDDDGGGTQSPKNDSGVGGTVGGGGVGVDDETDEVFETDEVVETVKDGGDSCDVGRCNRWIANKIRERTSFDSRVYQDSCARSCPWRKGGVVPDTDDKYYRVEGETIEPYDDFRNSRLWKHARVVEEDDDEIVGIPCNADACNEKMRTWTIKNWAFDTNNWDECVECPRRQLTDTSARGDDDDDIASLYYYASGLVPERETRYKHLEIDKRRSESEQNPFDASERKYTRRDKKKIDSHDIGGDDQNKVYGSVDWVQTVCDGTPGCVGFEYHKTNFFGRMKTNVDTPQASSNYALFVAE